MKCTIYTTSKTYAKNLKQIKIKNVEIKVIVKDLEFSTTTHFSLDWRNLSILEKVLKWEEIPEGEDFVGVVVSKKTYGIRKGLYGLFLGNKFQVFADSSVSRLKDTVKHEILHCIAFKLGKRDTLHVDLQSGKKLEDFEEYLWAVSNREKLLSLAKESIGKDVSPNDVAPDEYGCAESVSELINKITPFGVEVSTTKLFNKLNTDPRFERTTSLEPGNILISPTGYGKNTSLVPCGHTGVIVENECICSNDSLKGTWEKNYTISSWVKRFRQYGGYPLYVFKIKDL